MRDDPRVSSKHGGSDNTSVYCLINLLLVRHETSIVIDVETKLEISPVIASVAGLRFVDLS